MEEKEKERPVRMLLSIIIAVSLVVAMIVHAIYRGLGLYQGILLIIAILVEFVIVGARGPIKAIRTAKQVKQPSGRGGKAKT